MASVIDIYNMALSHIGSGRRVSATTEKSEEARACNEFYETLRDSTIRDFPWPFARKIADLGLIETDPNDEWGFSYTYPPDAMKLIRILSGDRNDNRQSRIPYKIYQGTTSLLIYTDAENAALEYVVKEIDPARFPSDFVMALSIRLGIYISPRLTAGDPMRIQNKLLTLYQYELSKAESSAGNEEQDEESPDAEWIRGR